MEKVWINSHNKYLYFFLMICLLLQSMIVAVPSPVKAAEVGENLLMNPGFEELEEGEPVSWTAKGGWDTDEVVSSSEATRTGNNGIKMETKTSANYYVVQTAKIEGGQPYELSAWLKSDLPSNSYAQMKVEFYRDTQNLEGSRGGIRSEKFSANDEWEKVMMQVEAPADANLASVYLRLYGPGTTYYDDASFHMIEYIPGVHILADRIFYYEDMSEGKVTGTIGPADGVFDDKTVAVKVYPKNGGEPVIDEYGLPVSKDFHFTFDPRLMNLHEPYTLEVSLKTQQGETLFEDMETIYRWERPTSLREDGTLLVDGEPFFPVIGYHVPVADYSKVNNTINTVQGIRRKADHETTEYQLDMAHKNGIKVFFPLYPDMGDLDGPQGIPYVKEKVSEFKDHPAILGWMIRDEPDIHSHSIDDLAEVYREIRFLDPVHPTYMVVAGGSQYEAYFRVTDIAATDIYPLPNGPITKVADGIDRATSLFPERLVYSILQAFQTASYPYLPNITELRHMAYQSVLEGAQGLGYYSFTDPGWNLAESELYPGIVTFTEKEIPHISDFILNGTKIDTYKDENVQWGLWEKDNELYAAVINLTKEPQTAGILLPNHGYQVETIAPEYGQSSTFDNELRVELSGLESTLIKLTPFTSSAKLKTLVKHFKEEGEFTNKGVARALMLHLTAVDRFERQGAKEKVVKHMKGFKQLLGHQKGNALISEEAYNTLKTDANALVQQMAVALLQMNAHIRDAEVVAGETLRIQVQLENTAKEPIQDPTLMVQWPETFGLDPEERAVSTLNPGQSTEVTIEVEIPDGTAIGNYQVTTQVQFKHHGVDMNYTREKELGVLPLIEARLKTNHIDATEVGDYPISFTLKNNASQLIDVTFEGDSSEDIALDLDGPIQIKANQTVDIEGNVHISNAISEGEHTVSIHILVDEKDIHELPITVNFTKNLLQNPGFEDDDDGNLIPAGWQLRAGKWVQDEVHSGQYAVTLLPDSENGWNVMNSRGYLPVSSEATYRLSGWVKLGSTEDSVNIGVRETDSEYSTMEYKWEVIRDNSGWAHYEMEFSPTDDSKFIQVFFYMGRTNNEQAWFDDFRFEEIVEE